MRLPWLKYASRQDRNIPKEVIEDTSIEKQPRILIDTVLK